MSLVNVLIAVEDPIFQKLRDNFRKVDPNEPNSDWIRNDLNNSQRQKLRHTFYGYWKGPTYQGTLYEIMSMYLPPIPVSETDSKLLWLEKFKELLPGEEFVLGAWDKTGAQYGTQIIPEVLDFTDPENPVVVTPEQVIGTPVYPIPNIVRNNPELIFPDDPGTGDPATGPKEVQTIYGWKERRWT